MILRPAYVFRAAEDLNAETDLRNVTEMGNTLKSVYLLDSESEKCYVILKCPDGNGNSNGMAPMFNLFFKN